MQGATRHHSGKAAEDAVARHCMDLGLAVIARRWRGQAGEIDLILADGACVIFVEVKRAPTHDAALARLGAGQIRRILRAADEFLATRPDGLLTEARLDLAVVDRLGRVEIWTNILAR